METREGSNACEAKTGSTCNGAKDPVVVDLTSPSPVGKDAKATSQDDLGDDDRDKSMTALQLFE